MTIINTICLCGSTRYLAEFSEANAELTRRGYSVITISMALPKDEEDQGLKKCLDLIHLNKILRSDAVVVVGPPEGYVGESTAKEIVWAEMQGKKIMLTWLCPSTGGWMVDWLELCNGLQNPVIDHSRSAMLYALDKLGVKR